MPSRMSEATAAASIFSSSLSVSTATAPSSAPTTPASPSTAATLVVPLAAHGDSSTSGHGPSGIASAASCSVDSTLPIARRSPHQPSHNSVRACFMADLAKVELQSIMHFLDERSLLPLARSSRWLYAAADSAFAWKHAPPLQLQFTWDRLSLRQQLSQSLWRHLPSVAVMWGVPGRYRPCRPFPSELAALLRFPRISALSVVQLRLSLAEWQQLGQCSAFDSLTSLKLSFAELPVGFLQHLTPLPRLSSLSLGSEGFSPCDPLTALPQLQSLTRLDLDLRHARDQCYDSIAGCCSLTHLTLHFLRIDKPAFLRTLQSPSLRASLQSLQLDDVSLRTSNHPSEHQLQMLKAAFSGFTQFRSFSCLSCHLSTKSLLLHLATSLPLTHLELQPFFRADMLSSALLPHLLQAAPKLQLTLDIRRWASAEADRESLAAELQQIELTPKQRTRFTLITE